MTTAALQLAITVSSLAWLVRMAERPIQRRRPRQPPIESSWSADSIYNLLEAGQHGWSRYHAASDDAGCPNDGSDGGSSGDGGSSDYDRVRQQRSPL